MSSFTSTATANPEIYLNVYDLLTQPLTTNAPRAPSAFEKIGKWLGTKVLSPLGYGLYHTSLEIGGYCYTFSAQTGITRAKSTGSRRDVQVPEEAVLKERILLGVTTMSSGEVNAVVKVLRERFFKDDSYHLVNRNCHSFTEVFSTALISSSQLVSLTEIQTTTSSNESSKAVPYTHLKSYPRYINRIAKSGSSVINHGDVCDVLNESRIGCGADLMVSDDFFAVNVNVGGKEKGKSGKSEGGKKVLTEKQRMLLGKMGKKS